MGTIDYLVNPSILGEVDERVLAIEREESRYLGDLIRNSMEQEALCHSGLLEADSRREKRESRKNHRSTKSSLENAWKYAKNEFREGKRLDNGFIIDIAEKVDSASGGQYRRSDYRLEGLDVVLPIRAEKILDQMGILLDYLNISELHPVEKSGLFHLHFVRIHPFAEGNGRTARLVQNLILDMEGYAPALIEAGERVVYQNLLREALRGYQEREADIGSFNETLLNSPPISRRESMFLDYLASKVNNSMNRLSKKVNNLPIYMVEIKKCDSPGEIMAVKLNLSNYFKSHGKPGQARVCKKKGLLKITGNISEDTLKSIIERTCKRKFSVEKLKPSTE
ncbi:MAG: Fic family protein [Candidatus Nanoarchaeia archaeon]